MQAIILAAGMGKRLKHLTKNNTKCMVEVNGQTLIERMLNQLDTLELDRIVIVVGYFGEKLKSFIGSLPLKTPIVYIENDRYASTNNIYSLYLAKNYLENSDTILLESDLIFENGILKDLIDDPRPTLALVDRYESWMDGTVVKIDKENRIIDFIPGDHFRFEETEYYYKTVNIYKFSKSFSSTHYVPFLEAYSKALGNNEYYEQVLRVITMLEDSEVEAKSISGHAWYEIDDAQDLDIAESIFTTDKRQHMELIQKRYGGYWRYPKLLDFCYLVNPFFPPSHLTDEMKANFDELLRQYPSGLEVNSLLAAKTFGIKKEYVTIGNGAAELIKPLLELVDDPLGVIRPTFEEYPNRATSKEIEIFTPSNDEFRYTSKDIITYFKNTSIKTLILINPDNPSGNYIPFSECLELIDWCQENEVTIIIDESFSDFANEEQKTFLHDNVLEKYPNLIIVKSISKSYGVPGIRLGIIASCNKNFIDKIKHELSIWNINSFGEFFMQIMEKYVSAYEDSLDKVREMRKMLYKEISSIPLCIALPSQANYITIKLEPPLLATSLTEKLLSSYNILVKDLSSKIDSDTGQYIRISIRDQADNAKFINALKEVCDSFQSN